MKQKRKFSLIMLGLYSLYLPLFSCSNENNIENGERSLTVTMNGEKIDKESSIYVSSDGATYKLGVKVSPENLSWSIVSDGDDFITASSKNGNGTAEVELKAPALFEETKSRKSTLNIKAEGCEKFYSISFSQSKELPLRFPKRTQNQIDKNEPGWSKGQEPEDFENPVSNYNIYNMVTTSHVALLWHKSFGKNPKSAPSPYSFDPEKAVQAAQECYDFIIDELHFSNRTTSVAAQTKFIVFVDYKTGKDATGGGADNVPVINVKPQSLQGTNGYGIFYHEMSHGFQFTAGWDNPGNGTHTGIHEYTSQWTLMNKYNDWGKRENGHLTTYMDQTHLAFPHKDNQYHAPYLLQYWNEKHSTNNTKYGEFVSRLWKEHDKQQDKNDVIRTFKRLSGLSQAEMMDEMWESAAHNITWDYELIREGYKEYINQHHTKLVNRGNGNYAISNDVCPQNYGYNAIKFENYTDGEEVKVNLKKNTTSTNGLNVIRTNLWDYRVGFIAYTSDGKRVYSEPAKGTDITTTFKVPEKTTALWLVVLAGPTDHFWETSYFSNSTVNHWPYTFTVTEATPDKTACGL